MLYSQRRRSAVAAAAPVRAGEENLFASTYDSGSIYEPIVPRPPSQMSGYSSTGSSLYSSYYPGRMGTGHNMESSGDPDFFGMCYKCGEKVLGEGSGCTAMDQVYHIKCFTCHVCMKELRGKPFFAMEGKPYCEDDYLNTLEKCCVCEKPILDRILRATGKPYHPACFRCVVCGQCLDGIPFTVDATSRVHCIDDFHKCVLFVFSTLPGPMIVVNATNL
ncbi:hypothetical protein HPB51_019704 [Rhipicephalus microplus]|uniref:LIM zinc-binding domain-containing protein n=1 Tax=Rhipicephalus microplus TaxID=6941 RepID=A0A9J6F5L8_RHIMP|nr:hypothetical protein HPB51_019704 [Rhipicephalus microplus]